MAKTEPKTILTLIGGVNKDRIGGNCQVVEHTDEKGHTTRIMIDLGSVFTPYETGFTAAFPNIDDYLNRIDIDTNKSYEAIKPISAIFLTHAHEDHIGALINYTKMGYQLPPIYAGGFTRNFIRLAFAKEGLPMPEITRLKAGDVIKVGHAMEIKTADMSHSVLDPLAFGIRTFANGESYVSIINNGDFKTDENMPVGKSYSKEKYFEFLESVKSPMMVFEMDSTSTLANGPEHIGFEKAVENTYNVCMANLNRHRIISPVISRSLQNIAIDIEVARRLKTKVFLDSQWLQIAKDAMSLSGYYDFDDVVYRGKLQAYLVDKSIPIKYIICSGATSQGMEDYMKNRSINETSPIFMSSAVKMALGLHPHVRLGNDTLVIGRQRIIEPINGKTGPIMYQLMAKQGAKVVITPCGKKIGNFEEVIMQDSGHADAKAMLDLMCDVKEEFPNAVILPIHGTPEQCAETQRLAQSLNFEAHQFSNLDNIEVSPDGLKNITIKKPILSWYAVKTVMPNPFENREVPLEGLKEFWEVNENYEPIRKVCEIENARRYTPGKKKHGKDIDIEALEQLPKSEKISPYTHKGSNRKAKKLNKISQRVKSYKKHFEDEY